MNTDTVNILANIGGQLFQSVIAKSASSHLQTFYPLPAAKAGTLTTRTDNDTGSVTLATGHGILTGDIVDLYWTGGRRYNVIVGTVAGDVVPIDLGLGNNLPIATTAVTLVKQTEFNQDFEGDQVIALAVLCAARGRIGFKAGTTTVLNVDLVAAELALWMSGGLFGVNPLATQQITTFTASQALATGTANLTFGALYAGTP